jgi:cell division protein FtsZ
VLLQGVSGITDLITTPGLINLDFADVKSVMSNAGSALMGIGSARGENRAVAAAEMAISSPLLEASIDGAHGVLLSIAGGSDLGLFEINEAAQLVSQAAHADSNIIFGAVIDDGLGDEVRVTVIAAGFDGGQPRRQTAAQSQQSQQSQQAQAAVVPSQGTPRPTFNPSPAASSPPPAPRRPGELGRPTSEPQPASANGNGTQPPAPATRPAEPETSAPAAQPVEAAKSEPSAARPETSSPSPSNGSGSSLSDFPAMPPAPTPPSTTRQPRRIVFDDSTEELDVPDFLK